MIVVGIVHQQDASAAITPLLAIFSLVQAANCLEKTIFVRRFRVRDKITEIETKWKREKRFDPTVHDHEVNLCRGLKASFNGAGNAALLLVGELLLCLLTT